MFKSQKCRRTGALEKLKGVVVIEDVIRCHEIIKPGAESTSSAIRRALEDLAGMNISRAILQDIKNLGKDVKKLKKHESPKISKLARKLVKKWKKIILESVERENRRASMGFGVSKKSSVMKRKRLKQCNIDSIVRRITHSKESNKRRKKD
eukprot:g3652.t1